MIPVDSLKIKFCNGFVNDGATFVIADDLRVVPNSMDITSFGVLQEVGIKHTTSVKEMTVNVTKEKVFYSFPCFHNLISYTRYFYIFHPYIILYRLVYSI